jgi:hypothetical protein
MIRETETGHQYPPIAGNTLADRSPRVHSADPLGDDALFAVIVAAAFGVATVFGALTHFPVEDLPLPPVPPRVEWIAKNLAVADGVLVPLNEGETRFDGVEVLDPRLGDVPLEKGDKGAAVERLQRHLTDLAAYRGPIDGEFGREVEASVVAVHKLLDLERSLDWSSSDWRATSAISHAAVIGRHRLETDRVEVDLSSQLLYVIRGGGVEAVLHVSTGNGETYWSANGGPGGGYVRATTPEGDFTVFKHISGWRRNYLGGLYKPWYFTPYYAVHGSRSVPISPASHGCVRVPTWESDHLDDLLEIGLPIHIWDV